MFDKFKRFFGATGIEINIDIPTEITEGSSTLSGQVFINASSDQHINKVIVKCYKEHKVDVSGFDSDLDMWDNATETTTTDIAEWQYEDSFDMTANDTRAIEFTLNLKHHIDFDWLNEMMAKTKENAPEFAQFLDSDMSVQNDPHEYYVKAIVDVKGAVVDPDAVIEFKLVPKSA